MGRKERGKRGSRRRGNEGERWEKERDSEGKKENKNEAYTMLITRCT